MFSEADLMNYIWVVIGIFAGIFIFRHLNNRKR